MDWPYGTKSTTRQSMPFLKANMHTVTQNQTRLDTEALFRDRHTLQIIRNM